MSNDLTGSLRALFSKKGRLWTPGPQTTSKPQAPKSSRNAPVDSVPGIARKVGDEVSYLSGKDSVLCRVIRIESSGRVVLKRLSDDVIVRRMRHHLSPIQ